MNFVIIFVLFLTTIWSDGQYADEEDCDCYEESFPLCGNDSRTYNNICVYLCIQRKLLTTVGYTLGLSHVGECDNITFVHM